MLYNDRAVLENHHVSAAYRLLQRDEDNNILSNLSKDDWRSDERRLSSGGTVSDESPLLCGHPTASPLPSFRELRTLVVEMVLATDMSCHFQQIKAMKSLLQQPEA